MTTTNMAPTEQQRRDRGGLRAVKRFKYELSENELQERQIFGGLFGGRKGGSDRNDNDKGGSGRFNKDTENVQEESEGAQGFKNGVSAVAKKFGDFFNPTRKAAAAVSTSTTSSTTISAPQTTIPSPTSIIPPPPPPPAASTSTSSAPSITEAPPSATIISSTTSTAVSISAPSPIALPIVTSAPTLIPLAPTPAAELGPGVVASTGQPRKDISDEFTSTTSAEPSTVSDIGTLITPTPIANENSDLGSEIGGVNWRLSSGMSPAGQRVAIAASVIGAVLIIITALFFFLRIRRGETFAMFAKRKYPKYASKVFQERKPRQESTFEAPPVYSVEPDFYGYTPPEKNIPVQQQMEGFYTPGPLPALSIPARARAPTLTSVYSPQQDDVSPMTSIGQSPTPLIIKRTQTETFYSVSPQHARMPSDLNEMFIQHNLNSNTNTYTDTIQNPQLTRELSDTYGSQNMGFSPQPSNLHSSRRDQYRMSTLSSLSSGFGDGLIIQDTETIRNPSMPPRPQQQQSRFSWQTTTSKAPATFLDRTSTYTTASIETAPRFRTVQSWVAHQTTEVERQNIVASHIPEMPPIPAQLQSDVAPIRHQRQESDISAFNYHPGDEIRIAPGSRVPSSILDRKFGSYVSRSTR